MRDLNRCIHHGYGLVSLLEEDKGHAVVYEPYSRTLDYNGVKPVMTIKLSHFLRQFCLSSVSGCLTFELRFFFVFVLCMHACVCVC